VEGLRHRYARVLAQLGRPHQGLPTTIGLIDAAALLAAMGDPLLSQAKLNDAKAMSHLNKLATARNKSVLAHGDQIVTPEQTKVLQEKGRIVLRAYWSVQQQSGDVDELCESLRFLRTDR
jgi:hypothetical protein